MSTSLELSTHAGVAASVASHPVMSVVRTASREEAGRQARLFRAGGIQLIEVTFSVPDATELVRQLLAERSGDGPPWIGMGTVTTGERARAALAAGAELIVSPNVSAAVAETARGAGRYLVLGALSATEIVIARELGSDLVKVYPLPPVGGPRYLATVRQPLDDIPMLAGGGFPVEEIPAYRAAGATAFGIGAPLLGADDAGTLERVGRALRLARGEDSGGP
ncbi:MAG TPA: 2-dehydro-3-deoxyphosphogluconate aldolase [Thermoanaerobaculia bacterium]|nr:2-dehydro-3-deoxyphosphogluconate aldolase [Thermoanaerobaculia bacterium]